MILGGGLCPHSIHIFGTFFFLLLFQLEEGR